MKLQPKLIWLLTLLISATGTYVVKYTLESPPSLAQTAIQTNPRQLMRRTALVIGNSDYQTRGKLLNPVNDAGDMAAALQGLGFEVILLKNANLRQMTEGLESFSQQLRKGGVGMFYYAGHGFQFGGENYLIPVDARLSVDKDVEYETLPVGKILNVMEAANNDANILVLDACRNNPFKRSWQSTSRSETAEGLAALQAVKGSYIAFATAPGKLAWDGQGRNGVFTSYLLKNIKTPNLSVESLFKRVRQGVSSETNGRQIPWDSSSLVGDFSFNAQQPLVAANLNPTPSQEASKPPQPSPRPTVATNSATINSTAEKYLGQGLKKYLQGENQGAIADFTEAIRLNPNYSRAYNGIGIAKSALGDNQGALNDLNQAIQINQNWGVLSDTFVGLPTAYYNRGNAKYDLGDRQGAIADYNEAIRIKTDYAEAYGSRGLAKSALGDKQSAITDYNEAIRLKPDFANAYNNRGAAKYDLGDKQGTIADYNEAIRLKADYALAYYDRGLAKYDLGDKQDAITDYSHAIRINQNWGNFNASYFGLPTAYYNRGNAKYDLGDKQGAIADYNEAIRLKPGYADAYSNRGAAKSDLGDRQGAIADYNEAIRLKPDFTYTYNNRGNVKSALGDRQGAIADYNEAIRLKPDYALAYSNRGAAKSDLGDKQGALADFREAAKYYLAQNNIVWHENAQKRIRELERR